MIGWKQELSKWAPELAVVFYTGCKTSLRVIEDYEFFKADQRQLKFHVLVTSFEKLSQPILRFFAPSFPPFPLLVFIYFSQLVQFNGKSWWLMRHIASRTFIPKPGAFLP